MPGYEVVISQVQWIQVRVKVRVEDTSATTMQQITLFTIRLDYVHTVTFSGMVEKTGTGYRIDEYRIDGYRIDGYRIDGYRIDGYQIDGYQINGYRIDGYRIN